MKHFFLITMFLATFSLARAAGGESVVIDVRTPEEFAEAHLVGAVNIDVKDSGFEARIKQLDKNKSYKVYCRSGNRSGKAEKLMKELGFKHVENIGSVKEASKHLNRGCEGKSTSC